MLEPLAELMDVPCADMTHWSCVATRGAENVYAFGYWRTGIYFHGLAFVREGQLLRLDTRHGDPEFERIGHANYPTIPPQPSNSKYEVLESYPAQMPIGKKTGFVEKH
jgi:hypothetical protein